MATARATASKGKSADKTPSKGRTTAQSRAQERWASGPEYADPTEVMEWAQGLPDAFLECREQHSWRRVSAKPIEDDAGGWVRVRKCRRCKTVKRQTLSHLGSLVSNTYDYPDGYQTTGLGRLAGDSLAALRLVDIERESGSNGKGK